MSSSPMSSLSGYYEGLGGNVTALPMDASFDDYNREGLQPQLAKSSKVSCRASTTSRRTRRLRSVWRSASSSPRPRRAAMPD